MWILFSVLVLFGLVYSETTTRFTNIKCDVLDPSYCTYKQCSLKVLGRNVIGLNVQAILLKGPFKNAKANFSLFRKFNGYRPFMFNVTFDFCNIMAKAKKSMSFITLVLDTFSAKSNLNHSCPYEKEIIVRDLILNDDHFRFLPLPTGEYQLQITASTDGHWKTRVYVNFLRKEAL